MLSAEQIQAAMAAIESDDPEAVKAVLVDIITTLAAGEPVGGEPEEPADDAPPANAVEPEEDEPEENAVIRALQTQVNELLAERESREMAERRSLIAKLVQLGVETPATAWSGKPEAQTPCKRLASEPIADMKARVEAMAKVRSKAPTPPVRTLPDASSLTPKELAACKKRGIDPADYIARKAAAVRTRRAVEVTQ